MFNDDYAFFKSMINGHPSILPRQSFKFHCRSPSCGALTTPLAPGRKAQVLCHWGPVYGMKEQGNSKKKVELHHVQPQHGVYYLTNLKLFISAGLLWAFEVQVGSGRSRNLNEEQYTARSESPAVSTAADLIYKDIHISTSDYQ